MVVPNIFLNFTLPGEIINFDFFKRLETTTFPLEFSETWFHLLSGKNTAKAEEKHAVDVISEFGDHDPQIAVVPKRDLQFLLFV